MGVTDQLPPPTIETLEKNLAAIAGSSREAVRAIAQAQPRSDIEFMVASDGALSAVMPDSLGRPIALASKRRPLDEANRFAEPLDLNATACAVVLGFGLGHHVRAVSERMGRSGVVYVYEPDVALLRAVFERIDMSQWLTQNNVAILVDAEDTAALSAAVQGVEGIVMMGVKFLTHAPSRTRLAPTATQFEQSFTQVVQAVRTTVITTMVQVDVTLRNLVQNLDHYSTVGGISLLKDAARGRPAIVISAGPSLHRNLHLLEDPEVRERFVIIAVQTMLKPLLERGIKPHFVTALDFHEISRRFYEGLTPEDVEGITLVAEPKANPVILESFPGAIRCPGDGVLDKLLGDELTRDMGEITPGATVAHLAYSLARYLGCDPVILMGQDLGFTDGQYYASGAAIHQTWGGEVGAFRTLEMFEWERIMRGRNRLRKAMDVQGRSIYTDDQMNTYLVQFEREFRADAERGCTTIDATEGGVVKAHTNVMTLAEAIERYRSAGVGPLSLPDATAGARQRDAILPQVKERVRDVQKQVRRVADLSTRTHKSLEEMLDHHDDQSRVNKLIGKVNELRDQACGIQPGFALVQFLNQTGSFKRIRSDRTLMLTDDLTAMERQRRQIERDITNVAWLHDAGEELASMLSDAVDALEGKPKITSDPAPDEQQQALADADALDSTPKLPSSRAKRQPQAKVTPRRKRVAAIIPVDTNCSSLGTPRDLAADIHNGQNALQLTLRRIAASRINTAILCGNDLDSIRKLAGEPPSGVKLEFRELPPSPRTEGIARARIWADWSWRGGLAGLTIFDELWRPAEMAAIIDDLKLDAGVLAGPDWCLIDPALINDCIDRYEQRPSVHRLTFTQAVPGLAPCLIEASLARELADSADTAPVYGTIASILAYAPTRPQHDLIARPPCVAVDPAVRDLGARCIADSRGGTFAITRVLERLGEQWHKASASTIASIIAEQPVSPAVTHIMLELCTGRRLGGGLRMRWLPHDLAPESMTEPVERAPIDPKQAHAMLKSIRLDHEHVALTLAGAGDPMLHPQWRQIIDEARDAGVSGVHVRTDLLCDHAQLQDLLAADIVSVDLMAETPETYMQLMGGMGTEFARVQQNLDALLEFREQHAGTIGSPWIVPRITRCDETYEEIESFYDRWLLRAGAAMIDPMPRSISHGRIGAIALPKSVEHALRARRITILSDGRVPADPDDLTGTGGGEDLAASGSTIGAVGVSEARRRAG